MTRTPVEPPTTEVRFPNPRRAGAREVVAVGVDFRAGTLLAAYRKGIFPWPQSEEIVAWFSPDPRALLPLDAPLHWSRSLRRTLRHAPWRITVDTAFREVMLGCATEHEGGTWITPDLLAGYVELHELGWAHSLEVWEGDVLVGGIYGIALGGSFAAESMFHRRTDASKVAFATLTTRLQESGYLLFDVQVMNPHLASLGCVEAPRAEYLDRLAKAIATTPRLPIHDWPG